MKSLRQFKKELNLPATAKSYLSHKTLLKNSEILFGLGSPSSKETLLPNSNFWPPLIEVADTQELPPVLVERYNAAGGEATALCGIFPEVRRAWASVDNSLFLWRFDKWDGQCPEYSEEQAICAVGLAKSKPGVFVEAIQYLLVLSTPVELVLVGVCCSGSGDGVDPYAEVSLQPLPEYTVPSDGVSMTCIACTDRGRIFLSGRDGHIYELHYTTGSGWHKRCRKVCLTSGLGSVGCTKCVQVWSC
uniref:Nucleoporin Nup133/Nup155-like N-terminal domain-containing protein n=1 Tax=Salix viminalis TaxID=40686 RepID=A0A6N2KT44_SALVM